MEHTDANSDLQRKGILWLELDAASQKELQISIPPRYVEHFYHHITLRFDIFEHEYHGIIGKTGFCTAFAEAWNSDTQAVRVRADLPDEYGVPHITLSTRPGIKPFASVAMLKAKHQEQAIEPLKLSGTIQFIPFTSVEL